MCHFCSVNFQAAAQDTRTYLESEVGVKQLLVGCNVIRLSIQTSVQSSLHRFLLRLLKLSRSPWLCTALPFQLLTPLLPLSKPDKMTCQGADFFFVFSVSWRVTGQTSYELPQAELFSSALNLKK